MPNKIPAIISTTLTVVLLVVFAIVSVLFEMLALNGASESQGTMAMGISLICQGAGIVVIGMFTWWLTNLLISKFNWNKLITVIAAVLAGLVMGVGISFLAIIISIPVAGIN